MKRSTLIAAAAMLCSAALADNIVEIRVRVCTDGVTTNTSNIAITRPAVIATVTNRAAAASTSTNHARRAASLLKDILLEMHNADVDARTRMLAQQATEQAVAQIQEAGRSNILTDVESP